MSTKWLLALVVVLWVAPAQVLALEAGARLPEIGINDLAGKMVTVQSLKGKVVIVDFWATWCEPCKEELPVLQKLYDKYRARGLVVIAVSVDSDAANVRKFLKKLKLKLPVVHDGDHSVSNRYKPPRMPSSYVADQKGIIRHVHEGYRSGDAEKFEKEIQALLR